MTEFLRLHGIEKCRSPTTCTNCLIQKLLSQMSLKPMKSKKKDALRSKKVVAVICERPENGSKRIRSTMNTCWLWMRLTSSWSPPMISWHRPWSLPGTSFLTKKNLWISSYTSTSRKTGLRRIWWLTKFQSPFGALNSSRAKMGTKFATAPI